MARSVGVDLTACWRRRAGMMTVAMQLTEELLQRGGADRQFTLFCSRERPAGLGTGGAPPARAVLSPHRHEVLNKLRWLPAVEGEARLDVVLYPYWPCPPLRRPGAPPAVMIVHDLAFRIRPREVPWQQRAYMGSVLPRALRQAAFVLTPSEATRRDLLEHYPVPGLAGRVRVVPEGWSLGGVTPARLPDGLSPGFLLAVGTIEPRKNYPGLLAAYRLLRARGDAPPLVVAGQVGWAYGRALEELRAEPGVRMLGHVDDATLRALYRSAGALAFPSLYEGFGLPLLEAMADGLPAVAANAGALPELAGDAALLVDPHDPEAIARALEHALADEELRARLRAAGVRRASTYTWAAAADATLEVLDAVAGTRQPSTMGAVV
ncbi:MAG TPA: glycosyltransferase family 1 protein [Candidatus Dormibacteraeota bacterium]|nr:glycosyltransferase family 1 protein [Candidatus Dormibacteraeota bacterium]